MRKALIVLLGISVCGSVACGGSAAAVESGGQATVAIAGKTFAVSNVAITFEPGENGYFSIEGGDADHAGEDCVPGLSGGLALYGNLPEGVSTLGDLAGHELAFEFSGDGDDFNLCFVGSGGLFGVEEGTVRFGAAKGSTIAFTFSGRFEVFDGEGETSRSGVNASGSGTARAE